MRSLFLDRCTQLQEDIIRFRLMFIQNGHSAKPLERDMTTDTLSMLVGYLVSSLEYDDVLLSLRGRQAGRALELLQEVSRAFSHTSPFLTVVFRRSLTHLTRSDKGCVLFLRKSRNYLIAYLPPSSSTVSNGMQKLSAVPSFLTSTLGCTRRRGSSLSVSNFRSRTLLRIIARRRRCVCRSISFFGLLKFPQKSLLRALAWKTLKHDHLLPFFGVAVRKPGKDSDGLHLVSPRMELSNVLNVLGKKGSVDEDVLALTHRWVSKVAGASNYRSES